MSACSLAGSLPVRFAISSQPTSCFPFDVRGEVRRPDADRVAHAHVLKLAAVDQVIDGRGAHAEQLRSAGAGEGAPWAGRERPASARAASGLRLEAAAVVLRASCEAGEAPCSEAARLVDSDADIEAMRQRLLGCVAESGWRDAEMLRRLALMLEGELPGLEAFVIDDTGFPKKGVHSVGVARQYSGTLGRVDNCQVATSLHLAGDWGSACIGLHLNLSAQLPAHIAPPATAPLPTP